MPGFHHAVAGAFAGNRQPVELAREADGEIANVDHFLHLAQALGEDLPGLDGDELAQRVLFGAQLLAQQAHQLATLRRGHLTPGGKRLLRLGNGLAGLLGAVGAQGANGRAIDGAVHGQTAADVIGAIDPQLLQDGGGLLGEGG